MTESAKVAIKKLAKKSPHVEIDVSLDAPVIFVPERSDSSNVLMLDFGHIDIQNSFSLDQGSVDISPVLDTIEINLTSKKIARLVLFLFFILLLTKRQPLLFFLFICLVFFSFFVFWFFWLCFVFLDFGLYQPCQP